MSLFDLKANIVPNVDPNCESMKDSMEKLKLMAEKDINKICASPNYYDSLDIDVDAILIEIQKESSKIDNYKLPELMSAIVYPLNIDPLKILNFKTINNTNYLFCRFPSHDLPKNYMTKLNTFVNQKYTPIIVNIEHSPLQNKLNLIKEIKSLGCIISIDLYDFYNNLSKTTHECVSRMLKNEMIEIITGFSKIKDFDRIIQKFSNELHIDQNQIRDINMWNNPKLISESSKRS